jgi:hypothetical protein
MEHFAKIKNIFLISLIVLINSCGGVASKKKVDLNNTKEWTSSDTKNMVAWLHGKIKKHPDFNKYLKDKDNLKVLVLNFKNLTSEPNFPIGDFTKKFSNSISKLPKLTAISELNRSLLLKRDGNTNYKGADIIIFGNVFMKKKLRKKMEIKAYSFNVRIIEVKKDKEILRLRGKSSIFSQN